MLLNNHLGVKRFSVVGLNIVKQSILLDS